MRGGRGAWVNDRMARYADPFACPDCSARLPVDVSRCPACRTRPPQPARLRAAADAADRRRPARPAADRVGGSSRRRSGRSSGRRTRRRRVPRQRRGLSGASVPRILLSLGALCLLVAAVIFLAVAWTWLGVGGRTAVLVGLTLVSGGLGVALGRRGLRVAAEALTTVSLGLLALDVVGADNAGWLGDLVQRRRSSPSPAGRSWPRRWPSASRTRLGAPQLIAALALSGVGLGVLGATERWQLVAALVVLGVRRARRRSPDPAWLAVLRSPRWSAARLWWLGFALSGLDEATDHATWRGAVARRPRVRAPGRVAAGAAPAPRRPHARRRGRAASPRPPPRC